MWYMFYLVFFSLLTCLPARPVAWATALARAIAVVAWAIMPTTTINDNTKQKYDDL